MLLISISSVIGLFLKNETNNKKLIQLEYDYAVSQKELANQIKISDSLILKSNILLYTVIHDTVQIPAIKQKYEKQKSANRELTPDGQLRFSTKWLSEADSMEN